MTGLYGANAAIDFLMEDYGMSEDDALFALDFAEDSGEYAAHRVSVVCMGRDTFQIGRR